MTVSHWQATGELDDREFDVAVVGAGIVGSLAAHRLAESGRKVGLFDARRPAAGASGRNAGMLLTGLAENYAGVVARYGRERARAIWALTIENRRGMLALADRLAVAVERCGSLLLAGTVEEAAALAESARLMAAEGFPAEFHERDPLGRGFVAGLAQHDDAGIDPVRFLAALLAASSVEQFDDCEVAGWRAELGGVRLETRRGRPATGAVVIATNGYSPWIDRYFEGRVWPVRAQMQATAPNPRRVVDPLVYANEGYEYFRQLPNGRLLLGGGRRTFAEAELGLVDEVTRDVQGALDDFRRRYLPDVTAPVERRWSGVMAFTRDGLPLVGTLPDLPAVHFAVGCNGHGMGLGLVMAELVATAVRGGRIDPVFSAERV